ncbi:MAG: hypothetical protein WCB31_02770 [Nitrososphaeraceae archaeon]
MVLVLFFHKVITTTGRRPHTNSGMRSGISFLRKFQIGPGIDFVFTSIILTLANLKLIL